MDTTNIIIEENCMVPMRDGIRLATDIYRPAREGRWPVLLTRLPYNKDTRLPAPGHEDTRLFLELHLNIERVIAAGYVVVAQDTRGRFASEGTFTPFVQEAEDGADAIAWAACQPWSSGQVGMFGVSYQGLTQWQAAREQPEALRTIVPTQAPGLGLYPYQGGAFKLNTALEWALVPIVLLQTLWLARQGRATEAECQELLYAYQHLTSFMERLPLTDQPLLRERAPYYIDWLTHLASDTQWRQLVPEDLPDQVTIPTLTIAGWHDIFRDPSLACYEDMRRQGGSELARKQARLLIGPWSHANFQLGFGERNYGSASAAHEVLSELHLRWYDHWLKGINNGIEQEKPVRLFVMGANVWRDEEDWPLPDTQYSLYYLHSQGHANTSTGDGTLSCISAHREPEDVYRYDPHDPVPTVMGLVMGDQQSELGPFDQREVETRADVLCYTTAPLEEPLEVTGPIDLILYVSSSARDTDFTGKLIDVWPDGRAELLTDGILRARYRQSLDQEAPMEPGQVYELQIELGATSNVFLAGHRIRLEVSSSNFPRFDRNTNTGGNIPTECAEDLVPAINRIYHTDTYPSHLILPIIDRAN